MALASSLTGWREEAVEGALDSMGLDLQAGPDHQHDRSDDQDFSHGGNLQLGHTDRPDGVRA